jgi:pyruvate dehydrogenase E1 component beta subunit
MALQCLYAILSTAETHYLSDGEIAVPIVFRGANGRSPGAAGQHARCFASLFAQTPGLKVVAPSTPADAKGLLKSAIREPGPVVMLEGEMLYGVAGPVPRDSEWLVPIGKARTVRPGRDVSIVALAAAVATALAAADSLAQDGIDAEIIDLRTVRPLDIETVLASVLKTGRLVTVEEGWPQGSIGSDICATIAARALSALAAAPVCLTGADVPMPYAASLQDLTYPRQDDVVRAVKAMVARIPRASQSAR